MLGPVSPCSSYTCQPLSFRRRTSVVVLALCSLAWGGAGCNVVGLTGKTYGGQLVPLVAEMVPAVPRAFPDTTVGLYVPPESAKHVSVAKANCYGATVVHNYVLGEPLKDACVQTLRQLFANAYEVSAPTPGAPEGEPDFVIVQTIENAEVAVGFDSASLPAWNLHVKVGLKWEVLDPDRKPLFSLTRSAVEDTRPAAPDIESWLGPVHSVAKKVFSELSNDLPTQSGGKISEVLAQRAKTIGFIGWVCPPELESIGGVLSDYLRKALEGPQYRALSAEDVAAALKRQDASLGELLADKSKMVALAHSLRCGFLLAGRVEREGENLHLYLVKYDRVTGARGASAEQVAQADDVKGLMTAVDKMLSSLQLGQRAP